jgi:hypothetical protein
MTYIESLKREVIRFTDLTCWNVTAGAGTGSRATLDFGEMIRRPVALKNPNLSELARSHVGGCIIFIEDCAWRLEHKNRVICSSKSPNHNTGPMVNGLKQLVGKRVLATSIENSALDLKIVMEDDYRIFLFCDCIDSETDGDNYSIHLRDTVYTVGQKGTVASDKRELA